MRDRAEQPCHGWGWKDVAPRGRRGSVAKPERARAPKDRAVRERASRSSSSREYDYDEYDDDEGYYSGDQYRTDDEDEYEAVSAKESGGSARGVLQETPRTSRSAALEGDLSVGAYPASRLSEYTTHQSAHELSKPGSAAHEPAGDLEVLVNEEGGQLVKLSEQASGSGGRRSELDALEEGLKEQSKQSSEYLHAIRSQLSRIEQHDESAEEDAVQSETPGDAEQFEEEEYSDQGFEQEE